MKIEKECDAFITLNEVEGGYEFELEASLGEMMVIMAACAKELERSGAIGKDAREIIEKVMEAAEEETAN